MSSSTDDVGIRRSDRQVKLKRSYSPEPLNNAIKKNGKNSYKKLSKVSHSTDSNKNHTGKPFWCDRCKTPFIFNPLRKFQKKSRHSLFPKHRVDPVSNQVLTLCNACGLAMSYQRKPRQEKILPNACDKEKYLQEAHTFAMSLVEVLQDADAERLFCPEFKSVPCACLQKYVLSDGNVEDSQKRALMLLHLLKEAKRLSQQKCYSLEQTQDCSGKGHRSRNIGLGNGQKRSLEFEMFVLEQRRHLRDELHLCERATQRVLMYSNNFLHKRLKTEPQRERRVQRKKGKSALGQLKSVAEIAMETCCLDNCMLMALTHSALLHQWRERAASGQAEARRVLAEMLTPCGGGRTNCYKFISLVTGCSHGTISKVNEQMLRTGGEREPPEHGLKKWWQDQARRNVASGVERRKESDPLYVPSGSPVSSNLDSADSICNAPLGSGDVDDSLVLDGTVGLHLRSKNHVAEGHVVELQTQESLTNDSLLPVNGGHTQVFLKLSPQLRNFLRLRKSVSLLTESSEDVLTAGGAEQLQANLFLSPAALSFLANENCQDKGVESATGSGYQAISHLVLNDVTAENVTSSGLVINVLQSSKVVQDGTNGKHSSEDASSLLTGDVTLLQYHAEDNGSNNYLGSVAYSRKEPSSSELPV